MIVNLKKIFSGGVPLSATSTAVLKRPRVTSPLPIHCIDRRCCGPVASLVCGIVVARNGRVVGYHPLANVTLPQASRNGFGGDGATLEPDLVGDGGVGQTVRFVSLARAPAGRRPVTQTSQAYCPRSHKQHGRQTWHVCSRSATPLRLGRRRVPLPGHHASSASASCKPTPAQLSRRSASLGPSRLSSSIVQQAATRRRRRRRGAGYAWRV